MIEGILAESYMEALTRITAVPQRHTDIVSWHGHFPFASWIIGALEPSLFVELGTHKGDSYSAFCQAVAECGLGTSCFAVDTWTGDAHSQFYDMDVYSEFEAYNAKNFAGFSKLLKLTFDEAKFQFEDASIDLLHIDGYHSYEAVSHDFNNWKEKLSDRAVVLFHDIAERANNFGVWKFWEEISDQYPSAAFHHSYGLGILGVGSNMPPVMNAFFRSARSPGTSKEALCIFEALGDRCELLAVKASLDNKIDPPPAYTEGQLLDTSAQMAAIRKENSDLKAQLLKSLSELVQLRLETFESLSTDHPLKLNSSKSTSPAVVEHSTSRIRELPLALIPLQGISDNPVVNANAVALGGRARYHLGLQPLKPGWYEISFRLEGRYGTTIDCLKPYVISEDKTHGRFSQQIPGRVSQNGEVSIVFEISIYSQPQELLLVNLTGPYNLADPKIWEVKVHPTPDASKPTSLLPDETPYSIWVEENERLSQPLRAQAVADMSRLTSRPKFSILMPVYNTPPNYLITSIESVRAQIYNNWELCISDNASTDEEIRELLKKYADSDPRIKVAFRESNGGISTNSNNALALAEGDYVAYLDSDDEITEGCLLRYAQEIAINPQLEMLFCDEDKIFETGIRGEPYFKPSFGPETILGKNMVTHLGVYRTDSVRKLGGMRSEFDGSQDWDLALRFSRQILNGDPSKSRRIPGILYHWRAIRSSLATGANAKPYAIEAGHRAVEDHLSFVAPGSRVVPPLNAPNRNSIILPLPNDPPMVSILLPSGGGLELLGPCIDSIINKTSYPSYEILVDNGSDDPQVIGYLRHLEAKGIVKVLRYERPSDEKFNYSRINNQLAKYASGEILLLLNDDTEILTGEWLADMVSILLLPGVGVVGAHLIYPNSTIQHAGVIFSKTGAHHIYRGTPDGSHGYFEELLLMRNVSAVTGACQAISKANFEIVGGLDESNLQVAYNDLDLCIKLLDRGLRVVMCPEARLIHKESVTRGLDDTLEKQLVALMELNHFSKSWEMYMADDPFYNPNLGLSPFTLRKKLETQFLV